MESFLLEKKQAKKIIGPVDLDTAANTGARIDMKDVERVSFIINVGAGTATSAHSIALQQHTVASAGTPAALSVDNPYFHKIGAATEFTKVAPTSAADTYDLHALLANSASLVVFEVLAEQLTDGYRWVSLNIGDVGGAQLGDVIAIVKHKSAPAYSKAV